ncbi:hypothetical protein A5819_003503 [Enterococcus sp. 7E2_DIV0204]|uniref:N-6 DNA methylase n=1 Tax=unclassified Enterococcus TaxID=2608891 RepID=UPI000A347C43|nr:MULTISPECIES: N-6 DNA methylase [unclassified Enterococcus]OTN83953.1 hypothetical protein A5819_003503 [Enterococcus sp. 7E2_DIV0204]OTP46861.1 hypothetical protein A5884_003739 [Enterococcus sp. 7D2_DIV0200]
MKKDFKQEIVKEIKRLSGKKNVSQIYFDWVHIMAYTLSNGADKIQFRKREDAYLELINQYNKKEVEVFTKCFALLIEALEYKMHDWLGDIYMGLEISNKNAGQFFTPYSVSLLMAEITFTSSEEKLKEKNWIGYYEPCCGAGGMTIAFAEAMQKKKYNFQTQLVVWCEDIDENCLLMTYVQLSLLGIKAICKVKNSLSQEEFSTWYTPFYIYFPPKLEKKEETLEKVVEQVVEQQELTGEIEQLALF